MMGLVEQIREAARKASVADIFGYYNAQKAEEGPVELIITKSSMYDGLYYISGYYRPEKEADHDLL